MEELRLLPLAKRETARQPSMKQPETFGGTFSEPRPWWELVRGYMEIHEPTMPTESIQSSLPGPSFATKHAAGTAPESEKWKPEVRRTAGSPLLRRSLNGSRTAKRRGATTNAVTVGKERKMVL